MRGLGHAAMTAADVLYRFRDIAPVFYDEMTNVPFIFAGPGIKQQKKPIDQVLTQPTLDLLPTLCDLAGIPVPAEKPGISLAPILKGEKQKKTHPYVVSEWHSEYEYVVTPGRMVRGPRYKYTHYLEGNGEELCHSETT